MTTLIRDPVGLRIAVLGWGSLLWDPRELRVATAWGFTDFSLPLEFSRVSGGNRLTLVVDATDGVDCPIYFALSSFMRLDDAVANLVSREAATDHPENVAVTRAQDPHSEDVCRERIRSWTVHRGLEATIWSAFPRNFERKSEAFFGRRMQFTVANARQYLAKLKVLNSSEFREARRYIENAPALVRTPLRHDLQANGWP